MRWPWCYLSQPIPYQAKQRFHVFDNGVDPDAHVKAFRIIAATNGVRSDLELKGTFGTMLGGTMENW